MPYFWNVKSISCEESPVIEHFLFGFKNLSFFPSNTGASNKKDLLWFPFVYITETSVFLWNNNFLRRIIIFLMKIFSFSVAQNKGQISSR